MNSDREARKKALEAAKARLEFRKRQKEQLRLLREQKQSGDLQENTYKKNDYGKKLVEDTKNLINEWSSNKEKEQKLEDDLKNNDDAKDNAKQIVPGPRADLNIVNNVNNINLMHRSRVEYVKEVQTDSVEIGQNSNIITEQTKNKELNEILATFIENDITPWPSKKEQVLRRLTAQKEEDQKKKDDDDHKKEQEQNEKKEPEEEVLVLSNERANELFSAPSFIESFRTKSNVLEEALGVNAEHSVFIEASSTVRDIKEQSQMEKLVKSAEISMPETNGRPITCLDYDAHFGGNRWLAAYSGAMLSESLSSLKSDGLINVFDAIEGNKVIRSLECQSMINCAQFHPTKENMIIGASVSGQVLGWDMRTNKKTPTIRTEFSSSCHTQPIFAADFLPSMSYMPSSKIQQILTLSNDAKLCVWKDDELYKPMHEFALKLTKAADDKKVDGKVADGAKTTTIVTNKDIAIKGTTAAKEITTTCFSWPSKTFNEENNTLWLGSDEGCIYSTNLDLNKKNEEKELPINAKHIKGAHYGPITRIDFHNSGNGNDDNKLQNGLYLTSSFDWTVKLWHTSSNKPISLFNTMQYYVYDVKLSTTNPSIFAAGDGSGNLTIFDLNTSFEHPAIEPTNILSSEKSGQIAITKLMWSPNGKQIVVGDSKGKISIFDCPVYDVVDNDFDKFEAIIKRKIESNDR